MIKTKLPVIVLRNLVLLPNGEIKLELSNDIDKEIIINSVNNHDSYVILVSILSLSNENIDISELPNTGIIGKITSYFDLPNNHLRITISGVNRANIFNYVDTGKSKLDAVIGPAIYEEESVDETEANLRLLKREFAGYISITQSISNSIIIKMNEEVSLDKLTDIVANILPLSFEKKNKFIYMTSPIKRSNDLIKYIVEEKNISYIEKKLDESVKKELDKSQKEFILKEKLRAIKEELGEKDDKDEEINEIRAKIDDLNASDSIKEKLRKELKRYESMNALSPEVSIVKNYIDTVLSLPFGTYTNDLKNISKIEKSLDETHYGLKDVKERILEYIAVKELTNDIKSPIICLVGPPGVGKTTLAESIANSLNKKFVKISLGGLNDPAELLGHRKTYIGSAPGKIITSLIKSNVMNPVILLDEIDKMSKDYKGDPVNALLDILDSKQNKDFVDNYIEEKIDLSNVTWILTANDKSSIPMVLQDRLDIIELNSYLDYEKISIAKDYLISNSLKKNGVTINITFTNKAILKLTQDYTKESGVRELDRLINRIIRKVVTEHKLKNIELTDLVITPSLVREYIGVEKYSNNMKLGTSTIGYVKGLAYTPYGGETLEIEVTGYAGKEAFFTSGHLGETLKESIMVSLGYIKSNKDLFKINDEMFNSTLHINFREGGIPKEGPSAGAIITTALLSYLLKKEVPSTISASGEITLLGDILPVGGIREKSVAAIKDGITKVYVSVLNKRDIEYLDKEIKDKIKFVFVKNYMEIYNDIFGGDNNGRNRKNEND